MNYEGQLKKIEEEIEKVKNSLKSKNEDEKIEEMKQGLISILGKEGIDITSENIKNLLHKDTEVENLRSNYNEQQSSDYEKDSSDTEQFIQETTQEYNSAKEQLALEVLVQTIEPENVNEDFLNYLYDNGFNGKISNPLIQLTYKTFCDSKSKDEQIQGLETTIKKQGELIKFDESVITKLTNKINLLHTLIAKARDTVTNLSAQINFIGDSAYNIGEKIEKEEKRNIFQIIGQKIKGIFSKTPALPPASESCKNIYRTSQTMQDSATKCKFSMQSYDERANTQEINDTLHQRQNIKSSLKEPEKPKDNVVEMYFQKEDGWEI